MKKNHHLQALIVTICLGVLLTSPVVLGSSGWIRTYQGEIMDILTPTSAVQTGDGGYAIAISGFLRRVDNIGYQGHFTSSNNLEILKTDSNGNTQWKLSFDKIEDPNHQTATIYANSDLYIIVQTVDQGYAIASHSGSEFWLAKFDSQGSVLWTKTYAQNMDSPSNCYLYSMIQTIDGGFALAGSAITGKGSNDFWLLKVDSKGNVLWSQTYNSGTYKDINSDEYPCEDEATSLVQTKDGGYVLAGSASLYRASTSSLVYATWIVKVDNQGKQLWNKGYDLINRNDYRHFIIETNDGGFAIAGCENNNFCLFKIDSARQLQWSKTYEDPLTQTPCGLVQLNNGGYAIAGTGIAQTQTMTLLRVDSSGQTSWTKNYQARQDSTTASNDFAYGLIRTVDGCYALVGSTLFVGENHQDVFLVKTETLEEPPQATKTTSTPSIPEQSTSPYPSPTGPTPTPSTQTQKPNTTPTNSTNEITTVDLRNTENQIILISVVVVVTVVLAIIFVRIRKKPNKS